jgi:hypothetical protein
MPLTNSAYAYYVLAFYITLPNNLEQPRNTRGEFFQKSLLLVVHGFYTDYSWLFTN